MYVTATDAKATARDAKEPVHFWLKRDEPWSRLHIDFAGPVKGVLLVVVDAYSNWAEVEIMPSMKTTAVIAVLRKLFATHGVPFVIVSVNGTAFTSEQMQTFLKMNGVRSVFTAPYHPFSNGRAERMVMELRDIEEAARKRYEVQDIAPFVEATCYSAFYHGEQPCRVEDGSKIALGARQAAPIPPTRA